MDEHSSPADAAETAAPPGPSDLSPPRRLAERVKACGDAATAILKALILALAIVIICAIAGAAIWRDQHRRTIAVAVDPGAEQALRAHGTDFDLRQALVDVVNDRVRGVAEIVKIDFAGLAGPAEPDISFKPFGLELSTGDVVRIMRYVLGGTPPPDVRIGLACAPQVCAATGAGDGRLLVTVTDPSGSRRRAYPIPLASPALRRALHRAIDSSADLVLEQTQPLIAAIYYLNRPLTQLFPDAQRRNRERAEGMALKARGQAGATRCIADLVIGGSLFYRGDLRQGLTAENRAAASGDPTCLVHAETNIVGLLVPFALCDRSPAGRERAGKWAHEAVVRLAAIRRVTVGDQAYYRIPIAKLTVDMLDAVRAVDDEAGRMAICTGARMAPPQVRPGLAVRIEGVRRDMLHELPPESAQLGYARGIIDSLRLLLEAGVPRDDLVARVVAARALIAAIDSYVLVDQYPRWLYLDRGRLDMDIAWAAHDALAAPAAVKLRLAKAAGFDAAIALPDPVLKLATTAALADARVDFENSLVGAAAEPLLEPVHDISALRLIGDARFAVGDSDGARRSYARAVDAFVDEDEPVDQILDLAKVASRWAALDIAGGACRSGPAADAGWAGSWARLVPGAADICSLASLDGKPTGSGVFAVLTPLVAATIEACGPKFALPAPGAADTGAAATDPIKAIDCLRRSGPGDPHVVGEFARHWSGAAVEAQIEQALAGRH